MKFKIYEVLMYLDPSFPGIWPTRPELGEIVYSAPQLDIPLDIHSVYPTSDRHSNLEKLFWDRETARSVRWVVKNRHFVASEIMNLKTSDAHEHSN